MQHLGWLVGISLASNNKGVRGKKSITFASHLLRFAFAQVAASTLTCRRSCFHRMALLYRMAHAISFVHCFGEGANVFGLMALRAAHSPFDLLLQREVPPAPSWPSELALSNTFQMERSV